LVIDPDSHNTNNSVFGRFTEYNWWFVKEKGASAPFSFYSIKRLKPFIEKESIGAKQPS
jgi:hypothetical protein